MNIQRGDRVTVAGWPKDCPLYARIVMGGKVAIESPEWPRGAWHHVELPQVQSVNGVPCQIAAPAPKRRAQR